MFDLATLEWSMSPHIAILSPSILPFLFIIVIRHQDSGACNLLSQKVNCAVLNAGDGSREHPTQALLDALIMHPGPMNRGVEIDTKLADDINVSLVREQVELGVAVRMACLKRYCK